MANSKAEPPLAIALSPYDGIASAPHARMVLALGSTGQAVRVPSFPTRCCRHASVMKECIIFEKEYLQLDRKTYVDKHRRAVAPAVKYMDKLDLSQLLHQLDVSASVTASAFPRRPCNRPCRSTLPHLSAQHVWQPAGELQGLHGLVPQERGSG